MSSSWRRDGTNGKVIPVCFICPSIFPSLHTRHIFLFDLASSHMQWGCDGEIPQQSFFAFSFFSASPSSLWMNYFPIFVYRNHWLLSGPASRCWEWILYSKPNLLICLYPPSSLNLQPHPFIDPNHWLLADTASRCSSCLGNGTAAATFRPYYILLWT